MMAIKTMFRLISRNRLTILIFHRVLPCQDPLFPDEPDATRFDEIMAWVGAWFNVLPLDAAVDALQTGNLPPRAAAISFDDGYADNHGVALPILKKHGLPATFFIATGFLDGGRMWNDTIIESIRQCQAAELDLAPLKLGHFQIGTPLQKRETIEKLINQIKYLTLAERVEQTEAIAKAASSTPPGNLMMTSAQVLALRNAGMQIGAHTVSHPILARTDLKTAGDEIARSKNHLENLLGEPVRLFAYPNGKPGSDYRSEHAALVRDSGFSAAVSTAWGAADRTSDPFQLPRFTPWRRNRLLFAMQLARNFKHP